MKRFRPYLAAMAAALIWVATSASAQPPAAQASIDPNAMAALKSMGAYLRTLKAFQVEASITNEDVLDNGLKEQYTGVVNLLAQKPDRLRVEVDNDRHQRLFFYDGKNVTVWARRLNFYATVAAPPTIAELAARLEEKYDIELPLVDLFFWGGPTWTDPGITAAVDLGPTQVLGTTCAQYTFRQEGLDWQIWIQLGDYALPRKLVITTTTDEARPQYTVVYTWNLAPSFNDDAFIFDPPAEAKRVILFEKPPVAGAVK